MKDSKVLRLKNNNVSKNVIEEHIQGLKKAYKSFEESYPRDLDKRRDFIKWRNEYFPGFEDLNFKTFEY